MLRFESTVERKGRVMNGRRRTILGLMAASLLVMQTVPVFADELIAGDIIVNNTIKAGVAALLDDSKDILFEEPEDILITESTTEGEDILLAASGKISEKVSEDIGVADTRITVMSDMGKDIAAPSEDNRDIAGSTVENKAAAHEFAMNDVMKLARAVNGSVVLTDDEKVLYDIDRDGDISMRDVMKLSRYVSGTVDEL